jgi:hypothetical protein
MPNVVTALVGRAVAHSLAVRRGPRRDKVHGAATHEARRTRRTRLRGQNLSIVVGRRRKGKATWRDGISQQRRRVQQVGEAWGFLELQCLPLQLPEGEREVEVVGTELSTVRWQE